MNQAERRDRVAARLGAGAALTVVLVNDLGFQYGAGIACRRTAQALLRRGHRVALVAAHVGERDDGTESCPEFTLPGWLGIIQPAVLHKDVVPLDLVDPLIHARIAALDADLVVVNNIHNPCPSRRYMGTGLLRLLMATEPVVACYAHDLHYASGGCYYPGACGHFPAGCAIDHCPQATTIPPGLARRRDDYARLFRSAHGLPLVANSRWTAGCLKAAHPGAAVRVIPCAVETELFRPDAGARARLGLPADRRLVGIGGCHLGDRRKGAHFLPPVIEAMIARHPDLCFLAFGQGGDVLAHRHPGRVFALGYDARPEHMAQVFAALDVYLFLSGEEALGQVLIEAAACAVPIVAFDVGGVGEVARHGDNALLCRHGDVVALLDNLTRALGPEGAEMGRRGRRLAETAFGLDGHADAWLDALGQWAARPAAAL